MSKSALSGTGGGVDFVVVGFGLGAIMMLAGFALRDLGPWLFGANVSDNSLPEFEMVKTTIRKHTLASIGTGIATAGTGLALVTFAALLARTEDDLGTIVVGMSLALAAVGVGAWTYDTVRRYRSAMDMVSHQEQSVLARMSPQATPQRSRTDQTISVVLPSEHDENESQSEVSTEQDEGDNDEELLLVENTEVIQDDRAVREVSPPAPDLSSSRDLELSPSPTAPGQTGDNDPANIRELDEPEEQDSSIWSPPSNIAVESPSTVPTKWLRDPEENTTTGNSVSASRWPVFNRSPEKQPIVPPVNEEFTNLPPLPEEQHDKLIGEAVRFDFKPDVDRTVPSWLFEDLEADLAQPGSAQPEDPIDQFRNSQPKQRGSALDRILAGNDKPAPDDSGDDEDADTLPSAKRRNSDED